jgi:DNA-directed RNA polymerase III subunit RPC8
MFILSVLEDEVALHPFQFGPKKHIPAIRSLIEAKFVDRVIPDVGLAVSLYDIVSVKDAYIFPGDLKDSQGDAACRVVFRLVVFRPKVNELLIGRVHSCSQMGIQVSLGFFHDVSVPANLLRQPTVFDERLRTWVWQYQADEQSATAHYPYRHDELICIRVKSVQFTDSLDSSLDAARRAQALSKTPSQTTKTTEDKSGNDEGDQHKHLSHVHTEQPPMLVVGSVEEDGLGLISWWI